jgi:parallel beta-helix repeat protein
MDRGLVLLVVVEVIVLVLVALGIFALLLDQYDRTMTRLADEAGAAEATEIAAAILDATTPTITPTPSPTATRTLPTTGTPGKTPSVTAASSATPTQSPTPRPTRSGPIAVSCGVIDSPGDYRLVSELTFSGDCIVISTSYVKLDCANHSIRGANFAGYGIAVRKYGLLNSQTPAYVEIKNCRVSNFKYGIWTDAGKNLVIHDNNSSNNYDDTDGSRYGIFLGMVDGGGIRLNNTADSFVMNNTTLHQAIGIDIRSSANIKVQNNVSSDNSAWGINFIRTQNSEASKNTTADNVRRCTWGAGSVGFGCDAGGIAIQDGSTGITAANNNVLGRNGNGIFVKAHAMPCGNNNAIIGNNIQNVMYNAVEIGFCAGNKINSNSIRGGLDGVWMGFSQYGEIKSNTISNMSNHGIISGNSHNNMVSGNQIVNSNEGLFFFTDDYDRVAFGFLQPGDYRSHDNCLCSNSFQSNQIAIHLKDSRSNQITNNNFQSNSRALFLQGDTGGNQVQGNIGWLRLPLIDRLAWASPSLR